MPNWQISIYGEGADRAALYPLSHRRSQPPRRMASASTVALMRTGDTGLYGEADNSAVVLTLGLPCQKNNPLGMHSRSCSIAWKC